MKKALLLFAALLVAGCGEKSSSEGSESASEKPATEPSADAPKPPPAETPVAESPVADSPSEEPSDTPKSLSDADVERLLKDAVEGDSLEGRDTIHGNLIYQTNESEPFSGWVKMMYDSGQVRGLAQFKDGKDYGLQTQWHENGQKQAEVIWKDGELVSKKLWNSKGEEVETPEEAEE